MTLTTAERALPVDSERAILVGRVWMPELAGPSAVVVRGGEVYDVSRHYATVSELCEVENPASVVAALEGEHVGSFAEILANTDDEGRDRDKPWLLAPVDLQALKAAGVTFAVSMIERVIEERVRGDFAAASEMRDRIIEEVGTDLSTVKPGSEQADSLKRFLTAEGLWSQYLEVGIGPDAEIFTKGQPLSAIGTAGTVGVLKDSTWNNPEPEVCLIVNSRGTVIGATLGNDVNLRDVEGRSALLLPKAKDNNASCGLGPLIRLFDDSFDLESVRSISVTLEIEGLDGFRLEGESHMSQISRDPLDLVAQLMGPHHQYPDGAALMLGTMFAPVVDRDEPGKGFTHRNGDIVRISADSLGSLVNRVSQSERCEAWQFGMSALMRNLASRQLL